MTRDELFADCAPLVERALRYCRVQECGIDDARQAACEALWRATERCDPERAPFFRAYAKQVTIGAVKNWLERERERLRWADEPEGVSARPAVQAAELSSSPDVELEMAEAIDLQRVLRVRLRRRERAVLSASLRGLSAAEHARRIGVSPSASKEWRASAIARLRAAIVDGEPDTTGVTQT